MTAVEEKLAKIIAIHPEGTMNVCTTFHGNPSNGCWYFSLDQSGGLTGVVIQSYVAIVPKNMIYSSF